MKIFLKIIALIFLFSGILPNAQVTETTSDLKIDSKINTIRKRFSPPKGFVWIEDPANSFASYISNYKLLPTGFPVRDYQKIPIDLQTKHVAVLDIDVGEKDLQQCADAWMRLYSEYLWQQNRADEAGFHFTSGQFLSWNEYKNGTRSFEKNEIVTLKKVAKYDDSYQNFRNYLNLIFRYAGTISLDKESRPINKSKDIKSGDFIIKPGSPGHSVIIVGVAQNNAGKRIFLLAESFMPAQSVHIIKNPKNPLLSPWYEITPNEKNLVTARYVFDEVSVKRFYKIP